MMELIENLISGHDALNKGDGVEAKAYFDTASKIDASNYEAKYYSQFITLATAHDNDLAKELKTFCDIMEPSIIWLAKFNADKDWKYDLLKDMVFKFCSVSNVLLPDLLDRIIEDRTNLTFDDLNKIEKTWLDCLKTIGDIIINNFGDKDTRYTSLAVVTWKTAIEYRYNHISKFRSKEDKKKVLWFDVLAGKIRKYSVLYSMPEFKQLGKFSKEKAPIGE